jgi:hypothetical protein
MNVSSDVVSLRTNYKLVKNETTNLPTRDGRS